MPCMELPASLTSFVPSPTWSTVLWMSSLISLAAAALRWASARTSAATTAKPRPCSPARAASTAALSARILVWNAIESMTLMISPILRELELMADIFSTALMATPPPLTAASEALSASPLASLVFSAFWRMVDVNSSMLDAVCSRVEACSSVRAERSVLPALIWRAALAISPALIATCATRSCNWLTKAFMDSDTLPNSPDIAGSFLVRSPWPVRRSSVARSTCSIGLEMTP